MSRKHTSVCQARMLSGMSFLVMQGIFKPNMLCYPWRRKRKGKMFLKRKEKRGKGKENPVKSSSGTKSVQSF